MRKAHPAILVLLFSLLAAVGFAALTGPEARAGAPTAPSPNFKVAFIGDQGIGVNAAAVLQLIADEGADMVLHQGDLGYGNETDPQTAIDWDAQVTTVLGADFPYFASIGNHDSGNWWTYQQLLEDRLAAVPGATCAGDYGVMAACTYQGLFFILSGIGSSPILPDDAAHVAYLDNQLQQDDSVWRICAWHRNQTAMQLGTKPNDVGWSAYETCRQHGAIIATGHEHSYSRTKTLSNVQTRTVNPLWPQADVLSVGNGSTFVFVSGLAGKDIRNQDRCLPITPPYGCNGEWASIHASDQEANYGALFMQFHVDGDPRKAVGYFKDIDNNVIDTFTVFAAPPPLTFPGDTDGDGCPDESENGPDATLGGQRDYLNPYDFYDVAGLTGPDGFIDLGNDILGVILHYAPGGDPPYDANFDRGPSAGPNSWNMTEPDGVIDLGNDILGVIMQYSHNCQ